MRDFFRTGVNSIEQESVGHHAQADSKTEFVVLPYGEFVGMRELLEDAEDLLLLEQAKREDTGKPGVSLDEMMTRFGITHDGIAPLE